MKILLLSMLVSFSALANFKTQLNVVGVNQTNTNAMASGQFGSFHTCKKFKGTYAGNAVNLKPYASGGSGRYTHQIVYTLGEGYLKSHGERRQTEYTLRNGGTYKLTLPQLRNDTSFVQQTVMLITKDLRTGKSVSNSIMFNVSRPVILRKSQNPVKTAKECFQVYPAYQSPIGILSNGSTNASQLSIKQGVQKVWTSLSGSNWGFYFSPLAWTGLGNILSFNKGYFTQYSKQVLETVEVSSNYQLSPGDYIQIYEQRTRYVSAFDAYTVNLCGQTKLVDEEYMMQWWGVAYHAVPVDPIGDENVPVESIGAFPRNSCSAEYSEMGNDESYNFVRTN